MQMRTFWALSAALALGCGGSDYSEYFLPATGTSGPGSATSGTGSTSDSTTTGAGGHGSTSGTGDGSGAGGSSGPGSGSSGTGNGTSGSGGRGGSAGSGGSGNPVDAGVQGCRGAPEWMLGQTYTQGANVRAVCMNPGGGVTNCEVGKTYLWTCKEGAVCGIYAPGADGWWGAWTVGMRCD
jgi:hypothetical protein